MLQRSELFIDGEWRAPVDETDPIEVVNPATERPLAMVATGGAKDCEAAVDSARRSFDDGAWSRMPVRRRTERLLALADILERRSDELTDTIVAECGMPAVRARSVHVDAVIEHLRYFADESARLRTEGLRPGVRSAPNGSLMLVSGAKSYAPIGVCTAIVPFNAPFCASIAKAGAALAMGNSVVLKPSPYSPLQTFLLADAIAEADLPPGVFNLITGGNDVGQQLTTDDRIDLVSFTGSEAVGSLVMQQAAKTLKRVVLELGGKSVLIVREDADLEKAITIGGESMMTQAGQACSITTRHLVHRSLIDEYVAGVARSMEQVVIGDPADPSVDMGPLIREHQRARVENFVEIGRDEGGSIAFGGRRPPHLDKGYFYEPTMFVDSDPSSTIAQEEVFGPVSVVIPFDDDAEAVRVANLSRYGLGGAIVSRDSGSAYRVAEQIQTGQVHINGGAGALYAEAPFGGFKRSGVGREYGLEGLLEYGQIKVVTFNAG
jgi:aldehyde dehydrogenase (NAD+)